MATQTIPKGYKQTDIGVIPVDWKEESFDKVCNVNQGLQIAIERRKKHPSIKSKVYITVQYINSNNAPEYIDEYSTSVCCSEDDVLMTRTGNTGIVVTGVSGVFHNNFFKINFDKKKMDPKYLVYYLRSHNCQNSILEKAGTSTIPDLNHKDFYSVKITFPHISEQALIATALSDIDALMTALEKLLAKKQDIKTASMQQLLTGKTRLPPFNQNNKTSKQTELGEIPEDWGVVQLGDIGQSIIGLTYSPKDVSEFGTIVLRSSNVQNNKLKYENNVYVNMELPARVIVKKGDILICVRNGSKKLIGKCAIIDDKSEGFAFGAFMSIYRSEKNNFIFHQFQSIIIKNQINGVMGATINQITNKDLARFKIVIPTDGIEQIAIAKVLSDMDNEIDSIKTQLTKTKQIKQGMMQELLTGRTRLI